MNNRLTATSKSPAPSLLLWRLLALGWAGLIFYLSTGAFGSPLSAWLLFQIMSFLGIQVSPHTFSLLHFLFRKSAHITEYTIFALLLYRSIWNDPGFGWRAGAARGAVVIAGLYALTDEFHQLFEPGRTPSLLDCGIDTLGAALGMLGIYLAELLRQARRRKAADAPSP